MKPPETFCNYDVYYMLLSVKSGSRCKACGKRRQETLVDYLQKASEISEDEARYPCRC